MKIREEGKRGFLAFVLGSVFSANRGPQDFQQFFYDFFDYFYKNQQYFFDQKDEDYEYEYEE